jgi:DNA repair exonuclease SbcCD ATPase subunit
MVKMNSPRVNSSVLDLERTIDKLRDEVSKKQELIAKLQKERDRTTQDQAAEILKLQNSVREKVETIREQAIEVAKLRKTEKETDEIMQEKDAIILKLQNSVKAKVETIQEQAVEIIKLQKTMNERDEMTQELIDHAMEGKWPFRLTLLLKSQHRIRDDDVCLAINWSQMQLINLRRYSTQSTV